MKKFEHDPPVGSIVTDLLSRYCGGVGGMAPTESRQHVVTIPRNSIKNSLRKLMKKFERDPTVGSIVMDLPTRYSGAVGGIALTGRRRSVTPIPCNYIENTLRKLVKNFERDPTVGSIDKDLWTRYSSLVGVSYRFHTTPSSTASRNS